MNPDERARFDQIEAKLHLLISSVQALTSAIQSMPQPQPVDLTPIQNQIGDVLSAVLNVQASQPGA